MTDIITAPAQARSIIDIRSNIQALFDCPADEMTLEQIAEFFSAVREKSESLMRVFDHDPTDLWLKLKNIKNTSSDVMYEATSILEVELSELNSKSLDEQIAILKRDVESYCIMGKPHLERMAREDLRELEARRKGLCQSQVV